MPQTMGPPKPSLLRALKRAAKQLWISQVKYGHALSAYRGQSLTAEGSAIPWFTYPAIDFLKQFDLSQKTVFEWGSGNSTLFWAKNASQVKSVEDDEAWFRAMQRRLPANAELRLVIEKEDYVNSISAEEGFDIIVIDGNHRWECAQHAPAHLNKGGMVILDNSWSLPGTCAHLAEQGGLIEVDFIGNTPITAGIDVTSVFLSRDFKFPSRNGIRPWISTGTPKRPEWIAPENWR